MVTLPPQLRSAFADSFSTYSVLRDIERYFRDAGVAHGVLPDGTRFIGERRTLAYEFYQTVDWSNAIDTGRVLSAWSSYLQDLEDRREHEELEKLTRRLGRAGLMFRDGAIVKSNEPTFDSRTKGTAIWRTDHFRLFLSHVSTFKTQATRLRAALERFAISGFVAHEDIAPSLEWQRVIERALTEMDALAALLSTGFNESQWTDQEIGFALGRGVAVLSVRRDLDPYGFLGREQAVNGRGVKIGDVAAAIAKALMGHPKTREGMGVALAAALARSQSWQRSRFLVELLEAVAPLNAEAREIAERGFHANPEVRFATDVPGALGQLIGKRLPDEAA